MAFPSMDFDVHHLEIWGGDLLVGKRNVVYRYMGKNGVFLTESQHWTPPPHRDSAQNSFLVCFSAAKNAIQVGAVTWIGRVQLNGLGKIIQRLGGSTFQHQDFTHA
jgi:hypothetical protein